MFHEMTLKLYFMKYSERKISQCILPFRAEIEVLPYGLSPNSLNCMNTILNSYWQTFQTVALLMIRCSKTIPNPANIDQAN